jgi:hypothetical protein
VLTADFSANAVRDLAIGEGGTMSVQLAPETLRVFPAVTQGAGS